MNHNSEAKIQKEIRRRAFERADFVRRKRQNLQKTRFTLDALQEVTGLPRPELESIAQDARYYCRMAHDGFLSIKHQILMTTGLVGLIFVLCGFLYVI